MNVQKGKLVSGGRLQLPAAIRKQLGLADGDQVIMQVEDGTLTVRPARDALSRIQAMLRPYAPSDGRLVSDELIEDRRAEAKGE